MRRSFLSWFLAAALLLGAGCTRGDERSSIEGLVRDGARFASAHDAQALVQLASPGYTGLFDDPQTLRTAVPMVLAQLPGVRFEASGIQVEVEGVTARAELTLALIDRGGLRERHEMSLELAKEEAGWRVTRARMDGRP